MVLMWVLLLLLYVITVVDINVAYKEYKKNKRNGVLLLHGILLIVLGLLAINTTLAAVGSEYELPNYETHQVGKLQALMFAHSYKPKPLSKRLVRKRKSAAVKDKE